MVSVYWEWKVYMWAKFEIYIIFADAYYRHVLQKHFFQYTLPKQLYEWLFLCILSMLELNLFCHNAGLQGNCCDACIPNWWYRWDCKPVSWGRWGLGVNVCIKYLLCMLTKPLFSLVINHHCDLLGIYTPMY
jgi:hypothetical protein